MSDEEAENVPVEVGKLSAASSSVKTVPDTSDSSFHLLESLISSCS